MKYNNAKRASLLLGLLLLMLVACVKQSVYLPDAEKNEERNNQFVINSLELLELHNRARIKGTRCAASRRTVAPKLTWSNQLAVAAKHHAQYMNRSREFSHTGRNGIKLAKRIENTGYKWLYAGENIAYGYKTHKSVMQAWLSSKPHCINIVSENFTQMGAAKVNSYWVAVFATPSKE